MLLPRIKMMLRTMAQLIMLHSMAQLISMLHNMAQLIMLYSTADDYVL